MRILICQSHTWANPVVTSSRQVGTYITYATRTVLARAHSASASDAIGARVLAAPTSSAKPRSIQTLVMADKPKKRRIHIGEGAQADALVDSFHELRGSMSVPAFLNTLLEVYRAHM